MANKGRAYAENLVGALDRSAYGKQRDVAQNIYNTNWQNVQNQYKNLQDKLKLQQQRANREFAEGLVDVAENSFNRQRVGSGNLANRGLSASGLTNILSQADTAQKGEDIGKLLKSAGAISTETADKLSQANTKYAQEGTNLMKKLANTLGDIGDQETAAQNRYNQTLAGIAGAMDQREANNALAAAQRAASRAASGRNSELKAVQDKLEDFYKRATIAELLGNSELSDQQKSNYLKIIFGKDNADAVIDAYKHNLDVDTQKGIDRSVRFDNPIDYDYINKGATPEIRLAREINALYKNIEKKDTGLTSYHDLADMLYGTGNDSYYQDSIDALNREIDARNKPKTDRISELQKKLALYGINSI